MRVRYVQVYDDDWFKPTMENHKMICCDCGLVHTMNFRIVKGELFINAVRDKRATAGRRRKKQIKR